MSSDPFVLWIGKLRLGNEKDLQAREEQPKSPDTNSRAQFETDSEMLRVTFKAEDSNVLPQGRDCGRRGSRSVHLQSAPISLVVVRDPFLLVSLLPTFLPRCHKTTQPKPHCSGGKTDPAMERDSGEINL